MYRKVMISGVEYMFRCWFEGTRNGFKHTVELSRNLQVLGQASVHYINRTWESYEYRTAMSKAVQCEIDYIVGNAIYDYRESINFARLPKGVKKMLEDKALATPRCQELIELKSTL